MPPALLTRPSSPPSRPRRPPRRARSPRRRRRRPAPVAPCRPRPRYRRRARRLRPRSGIVVHRHFRRPAGREGAGDGGADPGGGSRDQHGQARQVRDAQALVRGCRLVHRLSCGFIVRRGRIAPSCPRAPPCDGSAPTVKWTHRRDAPGCFCASVARRESRTGRIEPLPSSNMTSDKWVQLRCF